MPTQTRKGRMAFIEGNAEVQPLSLPWLVLCPPLPSPPSQAKGSRSDGGRWSETFTFVHHEFTHHPFSLPKKHFLTLAVKFISLGVERGIIYSSDPDAREPLTPTRGLGGEWRHWQKAHSGDVPEEARNSG